MSIPFRSTNRTIGKFHSKSVSSAIRTLLPAAAISTLGPSCLKNGDLGNNPIVDHATRKQSGNQTTQALDQMVASCTLVPQLLHLSSYDLSRIARSRMYEFNQLIVRLKREYGEPMAPPARGPFELVMWENACYLLPDDRRLEVFEGLHHQVGLNAESIQSAPDELLLPLAMRGGMRPEVRVFRWREIARITLNQFAGDLDSILRKPYTEAKRALKQFPRIGDPGAEKILLFCGVASGLPMESNGLRVLTRLGWGRIQRNYGATYRSVRAALEPALPSSPDRLAQAYLLLREHGKQLCKDKAPLCHQCPVAGGCDYAARQMSPFTLRTP